VATELLGPSAAIQKEGYAVSFLDAPAYAKRAVSATII